MSSCDDNAACGDRAAKWAVWSTWAVLFACAIAFVARFGSNVPYWDDWNFVPELAGGKPLTLSWLWAETNSHRFPVAKLFLWCLAKATDGDLRGAMLLTTVILGGISALLIKCASLSRGRTRVEDAFFPLLLLHWGHYHNLLWSINLHFACAAAVFIVLVPFMARGIEDLPRSSTCCLIGCAVLLPIQSAIGLLMTPAVMIWLLYMAVRAGDGPRRRVLFATVAVMFSLGVAYVLGLTHTGSAEFPGVQDSLRTSLQFTTTAIGPAGRSLWPASGLLIAGLCAATVVRLLITWRRAPSERVRTVGLLAGVLAVGCVSLGIGVARSGIRWSTGLSPRYVTLACPLLCCVYFTWLTIGGRRWARLVPALLCVGMLAVLPINTREGLRWAKKQLEAKQEFQADLRDGVPAAELVERHWEFIKGRPEGMANRIELMRRTGLGIFKQ